MFKNYQDSSRQLWQIFGKILNKNKQKHSKIGSLNINGENITNSQQMTQSFQDYFQQIGQNFASKFEGNSDTDFKEFLGPSADQSIYLYKIDVNEINTAINQLKNSNSCGPDDISSAFIKISSPILVPALYHIFNLSISKGIYPHNLKIAKVIPIHKKGSVTSLNNYRPISILNTINKIFEKILHSRLTKYITDFNILYKYQFGFRKNHSTELALIEIVDQIRKSIDSNSMTCGIFIDLSKAFDTVNHNILIGKLEHYGIRGNFLKLISSYLENRKQYTTLNNCKSSTDSMNYGVPQGSVLGPLFFILFINDLPNCYQLADFRIFADDTNVFFQSNDINYILNTAKNIMKAITSWFSTNKMTLNVEKSSFTIFKSPKKVINNIPNSINFLNSSLVRSDSVKFLGVTLDEHLKFDIHINNVCNKLKSLFHVFYNIRNFLSKDNIKTIYFSLVYSRIKYAITVYGQAGSTKMNKIQVLQNKLLKVLAGKKFRFSTDRLHDEFDLFKVCDINKQEILIFVHNYFQENLPSVFNGYYTLFPGNNIQTRNSNRLIRKERRNSNIGENSVKNLGADLWNKLSPDIKNISNTKLFKTRLKKSILPYKKSPIILPCITITT